MERPADTAAGPPDPLALLDWRRRIAVVYAAVRAADDPRDGWARWTAERAALFAGHPVSPVPAADRARFAGPRAFPYDPALRVVAEARPPAEEGTIVLPVSTGEPMGAVRARDLAFAVGGTPLTLAAWWLDGYAGGMFVPFADETNATETYAGGRYVLDTAKGADLGGDGESLVLDFNFAYNPSCAYDPAWSCPLPPPANRLPVAIRAGERVDG